MDYSSLRAEARKRLAGKWGKVALLTLVTFLASGLIGYLPTLTRERIVIFGVVFTRETIISVLLTLVAEVVSLVITFGYIAALWKIFKGEESGAADGLKLAFANWKKSAIILLNIAKKVLIPLIIYVAATIIQVLIRVTPVYYICLVAELVGLIWLFVASLHYALAPIIAAENPSMSETDVVERSKELMTNRRGKLVVLSLTFIGWCLISFGIGMLWVTPYMQFAIFAFYEFCKSGKAPTTEVKVEAQPEHKEEEVNPIQEN